MEAPNFVRGVTLADLTTSRQLGRAGCWKDPMRCFAIIITLTCIPAAVTQDWHLQAPVSSPTARYRHAMVFDVARGCAVMHGGVVGGTETWAWNGSDWSPRSAGPDRQQHAMAYDSIRGRVVLFGGSSGGVAAHGDTWEWDGTAWVVAPTPSSPAPRYGHSMAFDSQRGVVVLFGGMSATQARMADTWEWNGVVWTPRVSAQWPAARDGHAMAYDAQRGRVVMFGGNIGSASVNDTWEWDGASWLLRTSAVTPAGRAEHSMAYDSNRGVVVMFGSPPGLFASDTWEWDGVAWVLRSTVAMGLRFDCAMAFDSMRSRVVMFGGLTAPPLAVSNETWELGLAPTALVSTYGSGCGLPPLGCAAFGGSRPLLGSTHLSEVSNVPAGLALMALGLSDAFLGPFPLPLPLDGFGMTGCTLFHDAIVSELCSNVGSGLAQHGVAIPNNPALMNFVLFIQAWALAPGMNPGGVIVSNAMQLTIGNT